MNKLRFEPIQDWEIQSKVGELKEILDRCCNSGKSQINLANFWQICSLNATFIFALKVMHSWKLFLYLHIFSLTLNNNL